MRLRESRLLLDAGEYSGAYYLAGYSVECGLKACIARRIARFTFPDKAHASDCYSHDLKKLLKLAELSAAYKERSSSDGMFRQNWERAAEWSESSRYSSYDQEQGEGLFKAIADPKHGVAAWIRQHW